MERIYLDNAATTFPKPPQVAQQMFHYMTQIGCNINRGGYEQAYHAAEVVLDTREKLGRLFHFEPASHVIFTANVTTALNMLLKGLLRQGDHLLVSAMEHHAVMRPLAQLAENGIAFDRIPANQRGQLPQRTLIPLLESLLRPNTKAIVMTHASNVCGTLLPIAQVGHFCRAHDLLFIVDAAQTAGIEPIDMQQMQIDGLAFTGHKSLYGPQGIGGFLLGDRLADRLAPLLTGGTGSFSHLEQAPRSLPDRFEAGTLNLPGIYGLNAALHWLEEQGIAAIRERERRLSAYFLEQLQAFPEVRILGTADPTCSTAVISLDFLKLDHAEVAFRLDHEYGIMTRCGLHCAPNAHKILGTYPKGTVRFSFGAFNTPQEIDRTIAALWQLMKEG